MKPSPQPRVLAVDPGGSKCETLLVDSDGTLLAQCLLSDTDLGGRNAIVVKRAIACVLRGHRVKKMTVVGVKRRPEWRTLLAEVRWGFELRICTETEAALAAAGERHGVAVNAGTGSQVAFYGPRGGFLMLDGLGPFLGDFGSGYEIGREALRAVSREMQLRRRPTRLRRRLLAACGCRNMNELISFSLQPRDRARVASLAKIVDEEARGGDSLARRLLRAAALEMAGTVCDLVGQAGIAADIYPLVGAGSVAMRSDIYWRELCRQVRGFAPGFKPRRSDVPPVAGMAALGLGNPRAVERLFSMLTKEKTNDPASISRSRARRADAS